MKYCTGCNQLNADNAKTCAGCGSSTFKPEAPGLDPGIIAPLEPDSAPAAVDGAAGGGATDPTAPAAAHADLQPGSEAEPPPDLAPAAEAFDRPAEGPGHATTGQPIRQIEDFKTIEDGSLPVLGLLGFPTGGKTWFLSRLKYSYESHKRTGIRRPPLCRPFPPAPKDGDTVGRTNEISVHQFYFPDNSEHDFDLLDIPGDRFEIAAKNHFAGVNELILRVLKRCDAIIVVLPADELLFAHEMADPVRRDLLKGQPPSRTTRSKAATLTPPTDQLTVDDLLDAVLEAEAQVPAAATGERRAAQAKVRRLKTALQERREWRLAQVANAVDDFEYSLGYLASLLHVLRTDGEKAYSYSAQQVATQARNDRAKRWPAPIFLAISKMDGVIHPDPWLAAKLDALGIDAQRRKTLDSDPLELLGAYRGRLKNQLLANFEWCKVDFVTAFEGHGGGDRINYACRAHGVQSIVEWIQWAMKFSKGRSFSARAATLVARQLRELGDLGR